MDKVWIPATLECRNATLVGDRIKAEFELGGVIETLVPALTPFLVAAFSQNPEFLRHVAENPEFQNALRAAIDAGVAEGIANGIADPAVGTTMAATEVATDAFRQFLDGTMPEDFN